MEKGKPAKDLATKYVTLRMELLLDSHIFQQVNMNSGTVLTSN